MKKLRTALGGAAVLRQVKTLSGKLEASERKIIMEEIDGLRGVLEELTKALEGSDR